MQEVEFSLPALTLAGWQKGPITSSVTLCLHGWLDNANSFLPLCEYLPHLNLVAVDLPGHGRSQHRSIDAHYHFLDWIYDLASLIKTQGWQQVDIVGHSMGGMIGSGLAAVMPHMVRKLVLIDSIGLVTAEADNTTEQLRSAIKHRWQSPLKQKPVYSDLQNAARARQSQSDFALATALILAERGTVECSGGLTWSADLRLREASAYRLSEQQAMQLISDIQCPVLAILASDGLEMMREAKLKYQHGYRQLKLMDATGGHHCHMTQPEQIALALSEFLLS